MLNCRESKKCGRGPGGAKRAEFGECPAATDTSYNGRNGGTNAGRSCWKAAGTLCGGKVQGTWAAKMGNCIACDFYKLVVEEQGSAFVA